MKKLFLLLLTTFTIPYGLFAQPEMNNLKMENILEKIGDKIEGSPGN